VIGCPLAKVACIVDPKRDVLDYLEIVRQNGMRLETHVHAGGGNGGALMDLGIMVHDKLLIHIEE
jgi:hypothetical protein